MIKIGERHMIYKDPETRLKPEGMAVVDRIIKKGFDGLYFCKIRFVRGSGAVYAGPSQKRWIKEKGNQK
jgi:hypothetical protein